MLAHVRQASARALDSTKLDPEKSELDRYMCLLSQTICNLGARAP